MEKSENTMEEVQVEDTTKKGKWKKYVKRLGFAGFMFFLIKGLVWIGVFVLGAKGCNSLMD